MKKISPFAIFFLVILLSISSLAQKGRPDTEFGDVKVPDFSPKFYPVDTSAGAVYLFDVGSCRFEGDKSAVFSIIYERHARIRLLKKTSFDEMAKVEFEIYQKDFWHQQTIEKLQATTYNIEKGQVVATELDKKSIFEDKGANNLVTKKFTFPNIREGSIIEYDYIIRTPGSEYLDSWWFQGNYPRLWSEYSVAVPEFYKFAVLKQGYLPFYTDTAVAVPKNYFSVDYLSISTNEIQHTWAVKNAPTLAAENYVAAINNYGSEVEFQLEAKALPHRPVDSIKHNWGAAARELLANDYFGKQLNDDNEWLKKDLKTVTDGKAGGFEAARAIYDYIQDNYACTKDDNLYLSQPLKKTYQAKTGNATDINMLLAAMLKANGFTIHPVILSTRSNGRINNVYPMMDKFNYTITQVKINDTLVLLDASHPYLSFGQLPPECYNGYARVMQEDNPAAIDLSADLLQESRQTSVFISNTGNGPGGEYIATLGNTGSLNMRNEIKPRYTVADYFKDVKKTYLFDVDISNGSIDSLAKPDYPVTVKYDFDFKAEGDIIYFNPMLTEAIKENPFKAADRIYPVEKPYCEDVTYTLNMEIPTGYKVDELPKPAKVMLNETDGMFEYITSADAQRVQLRCRLVIKKANFLPEDYKTLRDFYTFIVTKETEQIVFKKL